MKNLNNNVLFEGGNTMYTKMNRKTVYKIIKLLYQGKKIEGTLDEMLKITRNITKPLRITHSIERDTYIIQLNPMHIPSLIHLLPAFEMDVRQRGWDTYIEEKILTVEEIRKHV